MQVVNHVPTTYIEIKKVWHILDILYILKELTTCIDNNNSVIICDNMAISFKHMKLNSFHQNREFFTISLQFGFSLTLCAL